MKYAALALCLLLLLTACGSDDAGEPTQPAPTVTVTKQVEPPAPDADAAFDLACDEYRRLARIDPPEPYDPDALVAALRDVDVSGAETRLLVMFAGSMYAESISTGRDLLAARAATRNVAELIDVYNACG